MYGKTVISVFSWCFKGTVISVSSCFAGLGFLRLKGFLSSGSNPCKVNISLITLLKSLKM